jgi:hypothetical protein
MRLIVDVIILVLGGCTLDAVIHRHRLRRERERQHHTSHPGYWVFSVDLAS